MKLTSQTDPIHVFYQNTAVSGEDIRIVPQNHNFFQIPLIQGPGMYINRLNIPLKASGRNNTVVIGVLTEEPFNVHLAASVIKKVHTFVAATL